jgi:hypothetical protein
MKPDEIRDFLGREFPRLVPSPRSNPDGWSFFHDLRRPGNRIIRATQSSASAATKLLLSISNRLRKDNVLLPEFTGDEERLRKLVTEEIRLYVEHFAD